MSCVTATVRQGLQDPEQYVFLFKLQNMYFAVLRVLDVYLGSRIQKQQQKRGVQKIFVSFL